MTTTTTELTAGEKIFGNVILVLIFAGLLYGVYAGIWWLTELQDRQTRAWEQQCIARGGKVTEYRGGMTSAACVGIKQ